MILNAESLVNFGLLIPNEMGAKAQVGFDLTIKRITEIRGGYISREKSFIEDYYEVETDTYGDEEDVWQLAPGVYSLTFDQGVDLSTIKLNGVTHTIIGDLPIPIEKQYTGFVRHRSSILRCGSLITSGLFEPGFKCDNIGGTMFVKNTIRIQKGARVAQFYVIENEPTINVYNGQYQGDKDKK